MNQRLKGEFVKRLLEPPPPFLNYLHNGLLIQNPPSLHSKLFISFLSPLHTSHSHTPLYSYYPVPSYLTTSPFLTSPHAGSILFFILVLHSFTNTYCPLPSYLPRSLSLSTLLPLPPSVIFLPSLQPLPNTPFKKIIFNETEDLAASSGDPHSAVPVCADCLCRMTTERAE